MMRSIIVVFFVVFGMQGYASSATFHVGLSDLPVRIRSANPDLKAARLKVDELRARVKGAGRLANPEVGVEAKRSRDFREWSVGMSFDQKFPLTSRLSLEKNLGSREVEMAAWEVADMERLLLAEAQRHAIKLLAIQENLKMRQEQLELAAKLNDFASSAAERGEISALDAAQMKLESQQLRLENQKFELEKLALKSTLKTLLGILAKDEVKLVGKLPSISLPKSGGLEKRPAYQLAKLKEVNTLQQVDLAKAKKWDDLNVGVFVEGERSEDAPEGLQNEAFVGFRVSIPWPLWNKNEAEIEEREVQVQRAKVETEALQLSMSQEAQLALEEMRSHAALAQQTEKELLPLVTKQTEDLEKAFEGGQSDLLSVLRSREQQLKLKASVLESQREFHLARIRYEAAIGKHVKQPRVSK